MKNPLYTTGIAAPDNKILVGGIFTMKDELGFPVDMSYEVCKENGLYIDWCEFLADAGRQKQWKFDDALGEIKNLLPEECEKIFHSFKVYGATLMRELGYNDFIQICEKILEIKKSMVGLSELA